MAITIKKSVYSIGDVVFYFHNDGSIRKGEVQAWKIKDTTAAVYTIGGGNYYEDDVSDVFETLRAIKEANKVAEVDVKEVELSKIRIMTEAEVIDETKKEV